MKKLIFVCCAVLCASILSFAQSTNKKSITATSGETYVQKQGSYTPSFAVDGKQTKVKNVILLIGDGMGWGAVNSAMYGNGGELTMTNLQVWGSARTQSADAFTTDSAASGTAYSTGEKTNNGYVGVAADGSRLENLPEKLSELGYVSGVVSTDDLHGATPAAFFAHNSARGASEAIWANLPSSALSFASAGTSKVFENLELKTREEISRVFSVVYSPDDEAVKGSGRLLYLPESVKADRGDYLPRTTQMAIDYLSSKAGKGFFLMVEGARIDKEEHGNNYPEMVFETLDFDKAVEVAVRFAEKDGHTLVIITADHETGAVCLTRGEPADGFVQGTFSSKGHSPMMVPLFAYGPHSTDFSGAQENSEVGQKIFSLLSAKK